MRGLKPPHFKERKVNDAEEKVSLWEQHAQTILTAVVLSLLLGSGGLLLSLREDVQVLKTQITFLNETIKSGVDDRFRGSDWRREKERLDDRWAGMVKRVEALEERHYMDNRHGNK